LPRNLKAVGADVFKQPVLPVITGAEQPRLRCFYFQRTCIELPLHVSDLSHRFAALWGGLGGHHRRTGGFQRIKQVVEAKLGHHAVAGALQFMARWQLGSHPLHRLGPSHRQRRYLAQPALGIWNADSSKDGMRH
jgi:hypothetical protein